MAKIDIEKLSSTFSGSAMEYLVQGRLDEIEMDKGPQFLGSGLAMQVSVF